MTQVVSAIYEGGVLKPLDPVDLKEHDKVYLTIEVEEERKKNVEEILELAAKCFEGLSEEEISIIESARLNKTLFFPDRIDLK